jgi:hypothetical protein
MPDASAVEKDIDRTEQALRISNQLTDLCRARHVCRRGPRPEGVPFLHMLCTASRKPSGVNGVIRNQSHGSYVSVV